MTEKPDAIVALAASVKRVGEGGGSVRISLARTMRSALQAERFECLPRIRQIKEGTYNSR